VAVLFTNPCNEKLKSILDDVGERFLFEPLDQQTADKLGDELCQILYTLDEFNDSFGSDKFNPVIPEINVKVEINDKNSRKLDILVKTKDLIYKNKL
jgi:hypothetical protein